MKIKNIFSMLLVFAMLMSICACGSGTTPAAPNGSAETKPEYRITAKLWLVYDEARRPNWEFPYGLFLEKYP